MKIPIVACLRRISGRIPRYTGDDHGRVFKEELAKVEPFNDSRTTIKFGNGDVFYAWPNNELIKLTAVSFPK